MDNALSVKLTYFSFFAMIMVLYIHGVFIGNGLSKELMFIQSIIGDGICRVAVPFFFIRAGYLFFFNIETIQQCFLKIKSRLLSIGLPYVLWLLLGICFLFVLNETAGTSLINRSIHWNSLQYWIQEIWTNPINYQLWFLRDLLLLVLLTPLLFIIVKRIKLLSFLIAFGVFCFFTFKVPVFYSAMSLSYFVLGASLSMSSFKIEYSCPKSLFVILGVLYLLVLLFSTWIKIYTPFSNVYFSKIHPFIGVVFFWFAYDRCAKYIELSIPISIASLSFFIFLAHEPFLTFLKKLIIVCFGNHEIVLFCSYIVLPLLLSFFLIFVGILMRSVFPRVFTIVTGMR